MFDKIKQTYTTLKDIWFPNNLDKMTRDLEEINKSMDDHITWFRKEIEELEEINKSMNDHMARFGKEIEDFDDFIMSEDSDNERTLFD